ncbi:helix-turn-helix domain-containing protein [Leeuwenhoekiella marinoflava]|uniref:Helix-turn-helix protein n=2 Tax=Leeuwenhoekiella marinoflava TaxID=988 RepID=A0A4Q0PS19_9FLAO|nr:helix-turn-helix transcriptional regulator [Leeuwenhoekiella marinoflava]RXG32725.1 helix-turn-helix protein [Leeuwenhoekiella marinoflava]SHE54862.1 Helix-turn-helix [Leeuwenhoekiella marinoflava DSM 3653]
MALILLPLKPLYLFNIHLIIRLCSKLTQEQLGELVGVKKAQISRLENSTGNVTFETVMRIFNALGAKLNLNLQM